MLKSKFKVIAWPSGSSDASDRGLSREGFISATRHRSHAASTSYITHKLPICLKINELSILASVELGGSDSNINFIHDGKAITDLTKSFAEVGIKDGDMIVVTVVQACPNQQSPEVEQFRQFILNNPEFKGKLSLTCPEVLDAALTNSPRFGELLQTLQAKVQPWQDQRSLLAEKAELYVRPKSNSLYQILLFRDD